MVNVEPYDGFKVSCDCGETFFVHQWSEDRIISCNNGECDRKFSIEVAVEEDDATAFGEMPA